MMRGTQREIQTWRQDTQMTQQGEAEIQEEPH